MSVARVVVESRLPQLDRRFDFLADDVAPGVRVRVPFGGRMLPGYVVEVVEDSDFAGELHRVERVLSAVPVLQPEVWALVRAVADRAAGSAADVLRIAIPGRQARPETAWLKAERVTPAPPEAGESILPGLVERRERIALRSAPGVERVGETWVGRWAVELAGLARDALARGEQAILVVPDHREQRQLVAALEAVVGDRVVELDARQSNPDRYRAFLRAIDGGPIAIVGPRSAVYAPAANLGLLAVWEDGDPLHDEPLAPYATTRDVALVRQQQSGCALVLAGHARSTETQRLLELGFLDAVTRGRPPRTLPAALVDGPSARIPGMAFQVAKEAIAHGPVLVQVARPGHAPALACARCGERARCRRCSGPLRRARAEASPSCAWCGAVHAAWSCTSCGGRGIVELGRGSMRTADELGRAFPNVPVVVADGQHERLEVDDRPRLVVATRGAEPIAAGGYHAVLLLDGERLLARESLRVAEDAVRAWSGARALARDDATIVLTGAVGRVAAAMTAREPAAFAAAELADRRALRFPPAVRVASVVGGPDEVERVVRAVGEIGATDALGPVDVGEGAVRSIVRFDYGAGVDVAQALRAEIVRAATQSRSRVAKGAPVRVHVDDHEPFEGI
ncbi:primosomal protein N' [Agrococcus versicolor]|uniref:Probable replication restart protein PriA n=1 Tax=Agrococcus versicolor TaxID=501482 RepID=A0ABP5MKT8_9MICO